MRRSSLAAAVVGADAADRRLGDPRRERGRRLYRVCTADAPTFTVASAV